MSLQRRKREVLRNVVNLPCAGKHVYSNWGVRGAVRSRGLPLVSAGVSQIQSGISMYECMMATYDMILSELCLQHCHCSLLEETLPSDSERRRLKNRPAAI